MTIRFAINELISVDQFINVLNASTLGERRPVDNRECMAGMVENADLTVTAWDGDKLVGVARSVTDYAYACYLSDLAVDEAYQRQGIGKALIDATKGALPQTCSVILLAAPKAADYYEPLGFVHHPRCWVTQGGKADGA